MPPRPGRNAWHLNRPRLLGRGFTLVELLVVIGIIALLISVLLPALNAARERARQSACGSNIRQLVTAALMYAQDNGGTFPQAHVDFVTRNLHRWHGQRSRAQDPFDFTLSPLASHLQTGKVKLCPSFVPETRSQAFEASAGGYGYNNTFIGSSIGDDPTRGVGVDIRTWEREVCNRPARQSQVRDASGKIAFADCAIANPGIIEYSFVEPPTNVWGTANSPSIHFRHARAASVAWADGHVTRETFGWTTPKNAYGADNAAANLGWFGPRDNALFSRN
jgi:prepilin-type N-terminal cleavage/methylation domain-containing protein/prepilin-type processing-associated H-X9-DG protein